MKLDSKEFIVAYGSLLSSDSRTRYSGIKADPIPITLSGWQRGWIARYYDERQTYLGVSPNPAATLNGALIPTGGITPELRERERCYDFSQVELSQLTLEVSADLRDALVQQLALKRIWICNARRMQAPDREYPFAQSYVDTCIIGCFETGGSEFAHMFVRTTTGWEFGWRNDRKEPIYPRAARIDRSTEVRIDRTLEECNVLHYRGH